MVLGYLSFCGEFDRHSNSAKAQNFDQRSLGDSNVEIHWSSGWQPERDSKLYSFTRLSADIPDAAVIPALCARETQWLKKPPMETAACIGLLRITPLVPLLESRDGEKLQSPGRINVYSIDFGPGVDAGCLAPLLQSGSRWHSVPQANRRPQRKSASTAACGNRRKNHGTVCCVFVNA